MTGQQKSLLVRLLFDQIFRTPYGERLAPISFKVGADTIKFVPAPTVFTLRSYSGFVKGRKLTLVECTKPGFHKSALLRKWGFECAWLWENYENREQRKRICFVVRAKSGEVRIFNSKGGDAAEKAFNSSMRREISKAREWTMWGKWKTKGFASLRPSSSASRVIVPDSVAEQAKPNSTLCVGGKTMRDMNKILVEVNLGGDATLRTTKSGKSVSNFNGANHGTSDKDRPALWGAFRLWQKQAEALTQYLSKGRKILVEGHLPVLPAPSEKGRVVRHAAEPYLTKESRKVVEAILDMVAAGHDKAKDKDRVINGILSQISAQYVVDVENVRFMDAPKEAEQVAGQAQATADTTEDGDDDLPF